MSIEDSRAEINDLDSELLRLLNQRARLALKVGESKTASGVHLCDHTREREVIERMCAANEGPLDDRAVVELYRAIIHESRRIQTRAADRPSEEHPGYELNLQGDPLRVAFQGARGAFSEEAAVKLLGEKITLVARPTFESLFAAIDDMAADYIFAPIENSLAGFVHACFDLLLDSKLYISGEVIIPISHCLIGCPGASFETITAVESHPVAPNRSGRHSWKCCASCGPGRFDARGHCRKARGPAVWRRDSTRAFGGQQRKLHALSLAHAVRRFLGRCGQAVAGYRTPPSARRFARCTRAFRAARN